jgi:hypothetical protein
VRQPVVGHGPFPKQLNLGSSSKEKPKVTRGVTVLLSNILGTPGAADIAFYVGAR